MASWKESMINRLSNLINCNRSASKISQVLCSTILPICYQAEMQESGLMAQFGQYSNRFFNNTKGNKLSISPMKDVKLLLFKVCTMREQGKLDPLSCYQAIMKVRYNSLGLGDILSQ